jgi:large exoprotein involved in heme utilization and adhesion
VVGGDIRIADGTLYAPGGRIDMVSVASPGEVFPNAPDLGVASFERLGRIEVSHASSERPLVYPSLPLEGGPEVLGNVIGNVDASSEGGGRIFIRGGQFVADNAFIFANTRASGEGQGIDMGVTDQVTVRNGALINAHTFGSGGGGDLTVKAGSLEVRNGAQINTGSFPQGEGPQGEGGDVIVTADRVFLLGDGANFPPTGIFASTGIFAEEAHGAAGNVTVTAGNLEVRNGAEISTGSFGGRGGNVTVTADRVFLSGDGATDSEGSSIPTGIFAIAALGSKGAGNITVTAGNLEMRNAEISTDSFGGRGGNVTVTADRVFLSGDGANSDGFPIATGIFATGGSVFIDGELLEAEPGNITVTADNLEVRNGAVISAGSFGGPGGNVTVTADRVFLSGDGAFFSTGIFAGGFGGPFEGELFEAEAGNITVTAGNLEVRNGAVISASVEGLGQGGNVKINATDITLQDGGRISAESSSADTADAGNITLEVGNLLHLSNDSRITTSAVGGTGNGGNITLNSVLVVLDERSSIIANAEGGQGGNIFIRILGGGALFRSPDNLIEASSELGIDGSVVIDAPDTDIIAGFAGLPVNFLDAATVLTQLCAGRSGANVSSLVVRKYEVLPDSPYALRVQLPHAIPAPRTAKQSRAPRTYYAGSPLPPMISCLGNG